MVSPNAAASHEYRCPKCRYVLFRSTDVDASGQYGEASAQKSIAGKNWNKGGMPSLDDGVDATSLFLPAEVAEPMLGEEAYTGADSGKLYCPKCKHKVDRPPVVPFSLSLPLPPFQGGAFQVVRGAGQPGAFPLPRLQRPQIPRRLYARPPLCAAMCSCCGGDPCAGGTAPGVARWRRGVNPNG